MAKVEAWYCLQSQLSANTMSTHMIQITYIKVQVKVKDSKIKFLQSSGNLTIQET